MAGVRGRILLAANTVLIELARNLHCIHTVKNTSHGVGTEKRPLLGSVRLEEANR